MLLIDTYLSTSKIQGIGIFTHEEIPKGKIIWKFNPYVDLEYSHDEWNELKKNINKFSYSQIKKYAYKYKGKYYLSIDNSQFMNHANDNYNIKNDPINDTMFALRDIRQNEELTCNYYEFCDEDDSCIISFGNN